MTRRTPGARLRDLEDRAGWRSGFRECRVCRGFDPPIVLIERKEDEEMRGRCRGCGRKYVKALWVYAPDEVMGLPREGEGVGA